MRTTKRFAGLAAVAAAAIPAVGAADASAADNFRHLGVLKVNETEDFGWGGDEPYITVNGKERWKAGGEMDNGAKADVNINVRIGKTVRVYDRDLAGQPDPDDLIGSFRVEGWGVVSLTNDDADYTLEVQR
jgi:hypothetical protein